MATRRNHVIQTPGQAPELPETTDQQQDAVPADPLAAGSELPDIEENPNPGDAPPAQSEPEPPTPAPAASAAPRLYRDMRANEIDVSKLAAPVLCKDGWLVPPTIGPARAPVGA